MNEFEKMEQVRMIACRQRMKNATEKELSQAFCKELNKRMESMIYDPYTDDNNFINELLKLSERHREIFADIISRNIELEEQNNEFKVNMDIAFKYFNQYNDNLNKILEAYAILD